MKISVIVPVYNVELYLERCIKSILSQTYKDFELILVDDGSPDKSGEICDHYRSIDSRICVIHKENGGLSDARNVGVLSATGEYITFVDSDDYVSSNYLEYLLDLAMKTNADISVGCFRRTESDECDFQRKRKYQDITILDSKTGCMEILTMGRYEPMLVTAWCKLIKRDVCLECPFPVGFKHEDRATTYKYYYHCRKIAFGNQEIYAYYANPNGIIHTLGDGKNHDMIAARTDCAVFFENKGEKELAILAWKDVFQYLYTDSATHNGRCDFEISKLISDDHVDKRTAYFIRIYLRFPRPFRLQKQFRLYLKTFFKLLRSSCGRKMIAKKCQKCLRLLLAKDERSK